MKKFILAITISLGFISPGAFANDDSVNAHLATTLSMLFKITDNKNLLNANDYHQTTLVYQGMPIVAFKSNTSNWVGFFKKLSTNNLPGNARLRIAKKYNDCTIKEVSMYIDTDGNMSYFAEITHNKKCIVLEIESTGRVHKFNCRNARKMK